MDANTVAHLVLCPDILNRGNCTAATGECDYSHSVFGCEACHLLFATEDQLRTHVDGSEHQRTATGSDLTFLRCPLCEVIVLAESGVMTVHERGKAHRKKVTASGRPASDVIPVPAPDPSKVYCDICKREVATSGWSTHVQSDAHLEREQHRLYVQRVQESAKDRHGVRIEEARIDYGDIEKYRLLNEREFKGIFHIQVTQPTFLTDVRMASSVGPFAREVNFFVPTFTRRADMVPGFRYALTVTFMPHASVGRFIDRLECVFESSDDNLRFAITRPVEANIVDSSEQALLAPEAPYQRPIKRSTEVFEILDKGDRPPGQGKKKAGKLPKFDIPQYVKDLKQTGSLTKRLEEARSLLSPEFSASSYGDWWHILLWLEEIQAAKDMSIFDRNDTRFARKSATLYWLNVPGLAEKRPSVMIGDTILVQPHSPASNRWHRGFVHEIFELQVGIDFSRNFKLPLTQPINVRFELNRLLFKRMHLAVDGPYVDARIPFPTREDVERLELKSPSLDVLRRYHPNFVKMGDNPPQWLAVTAISALPPGSVPFVIFGPPGTGKTVVVVEAIKQIIQKNPEAFILAAAPSNSAADIITERLADGDHALTPKELFRMNAPNRGPDMPMTLDRFATKRIGHRYDVPNSFRLLQFKVIVTTCASAYQLHRVGVPKTFTHVFVDEVGHASEAEAMIPVKFASSKHTNVILAGDPKQLGPIVHSTVAARLGMEVSWLERLMSLDIYDHSSQSGITVVKLLHNFRSHPAILSFPNDKFYDGELLARGSRELIDSCLSWPGLEGKKSPVVFHGIKGKDMRESSSPSWFNPHEVSLVKDYIQDLLDAGLGLEPRDIGVVAPYHKQCQKIRTLLKQNQWEGLKVGSAELFQGDERRVIIVSTVRSSAEFLDFDLRHTLGFVANPRRFNVAITRAQALLIVVGDPDVLGLDPTWRSFLTYIHKSAVWKGRSIPWDPDEVLEEGAQDLDARRRAEAAQELEETARRTRDMVRNPQLLDEDAEEEQAARELEAAEDQPVWDD